MRWSGLECFSLAAAHVRLLVLGLAFTDDQKNNIPCHGHMALALHLWLLQLYSFGLVSHIIFS
jgi:hypothetical protein